MSEEGWQYQLPMQFGCCLLFGPALGVSCFHILRQLREPVIRVGPEVLMIAKEGERRNVPSHGEDVTRL